MKELVLDLVASCENRISMVEEVITGSYYTTATLDESLAEVAKKRAGLETSLQETLARNCFLRRKDFNTLMERIIADSQRGKRELEEQRKHVRDELKGYLDEQKQLVASLRQQLVEFTRDKEDKGALEATIAKMMVAYQHKGQQVFGLLRDFQSHLETFRREQEEMNCQLQRLVERGESLKLEDLRRLEAVKAGQDRRAETELRRQEVETLLAHFKVQRQGNSRRGR